MTFCPRFGVIAGRAAEAWRGRGSDVDVWHATSLNWLLFTYFVVFIIGTLMIAARRPLWNDELFTYYIATLPGLSDVWSALLTGHDPTPPGFYVLVRQALQLFGDENVAIRVPALIGCLMMSVAIFKFVSIRLSPVYGLLAALFPMLCSARDYAYEARPYGLVLGFASLALLCWQRATATAGNRALTLIGLAFSLAGGTACHYYGILIVLPLAAGEVVRTAERRRVDWAIWGCLLASVLPLAFVMPLIMSAAKLSGGFWAPPHWRDAANFYPALLITAVFPIVAVVTAAVIAPRLPPVFVDKDIVAFNRSFPNHELAAVAGFVALPVLGVMLAELVTKAYTDRYVLAAVVGIGIIFAQAMHKLLSGRFGFAAIAALFLIVWIGDLERGNLNVIEHSQESFNKSMDLLRSADEDNIPIVAAEAHTFTELTHYAPADVASRLVYLADSALADRILG